MDEQLYDDLIIEIRAKSIEVRGVLGTEKCYIRKSGMKFHVDLHAIVSGEISVKVGHGIAHELKDYLRAEIRNLGQILIHIEPIE
jgi:divalent metal cation (Fe/Co/Zn/Cd) transporter